MKCYNEKSGNRYDYNGLLERFAHMTDFQVKLEYASVLNALARLERYEQDEQRYCYYAEPLIDAQHFLEGYIARKALLRGKFYMNHKDELCLDVQGRDLLHC